jgi:capsular exopolysaccharide synthesis family protein
MLGARGRERPLSERWSDESVFRDWMTLLARRRVMVIAAIVVVPAIAFVVSHQQQRLYQSTATVLVNEQSPADAAVELNAQTASPPDRYAATQAALARVGTVAEIAVASAGVPGKTAGGLLASSSVTASPTADLLSFAVTDPDPAVAQKLAGAYARAYTTYRRRLDVRALTSAVGDVQRRLATLRAAGQAKSPLYRQLTRNERNLEALQTLGTSGASAQVLGRPGSATQVQPKTIRNVALGMLVGIALGVALAFLREALDTRVRSADEVRDRLGLPLLGHVPPPEPGLNGSGLATLSAPAGAGAEAFRILRTTLDITRLQHDVASIVITSTTAGEGKSTTAANLAVTLARSGRHVILLDLDLRQPGVDRFFDLDGRPGLTSVAVGEAGMADVLSVIDVHPESPVADSGLLEVVKVGAAPPDPGEFLSSAFVTEAVHVLARRCDVLLIDSPPMLAVGDAMAIATSADAVVVVTELNEIRRVTLAEARRILQSCPARKLGFIATGSEGGSGYGYGYGANGHRDAGRV